MVEAFDSLLVVYDLGDPLAWRAANRHRRIWGELYTDIHALEDDYILLVFRAARDQRWRPWETVRRQWILEQLEESEAA